MGGNVEVEVALGRFVQKDKKRQKKRPKKRTKGQKDKRTIRQ